MEDEALKNGPCPCGSGRKYKDCCMNKPGILSGSIQQQLQDWLKRHPGATQKELEAFVSRLMEEANKEPIDDFMGLSSEQMFQLLNFTRTQKLIEFPVHPGQRPESPMLRLFSYLAEAIGESGLKSTVKGNLPREFCRRTALMYLGETGYKEMTRYGNINTEEDFSDLHITKLVSRMAGLITLRGGKYRLTGKAVKLLKHRDDGAILKALMEEFTYKFNLGYRDRYPLLYIIQRSLLFSLYVIKLFGNEIRQSIFYEEAFMRAFPDALLEVEGNQYFTSENMIGSAYSIRVFRMFLRLSGLCEIEEKGDILHRSYEMRVLPLFDSMIKFNLPCRRPDNLFSLN